MALSWGEPGLISSYIIYDCLKSYYNKAEPFYEGRLARNQSVSKLPKV